MLSIWLYLRGFKSHHRYASNSLYGEMVSSMDFKFSDPSLMLNKITENDFKVLRCLGWLVSFRNITLSIAHENVESTSHLIRSGSNRRFCA